MLPNNAISITMDGAGDRGWEELNVEIKHETSSFHRIQLTMCQWHSVNAIKFDFILH